MRAQLRSISLKSLIAGLVLSIKMGGASPAFSAERVRINPASLRERLIAGNHGVLRGMEKLIQAKDQVNVSRGQLLPGVNLGMVLGSSAGPSFVLSSVTFLVPFLLPSNWASLKASESLFEAEKDSYLLLGLNQYASAYALYATIQQDLALRESARQQYEDLRQIEEYLAFGERVGNVAPQDLERAQAQAQLALVRFSQLDSLLASEKARLRAALALPLDASIEIEPGSVPASEDEELSVSVLLEKAIEIAPENSQIASLIASARAGASSRAWAFLSSSTLSGQTQMSGGAPSGVSLDQLTQGASLSLGFGYFPTVQLGQDQARELELRQDEIRTELARIAETALFSISEAKKQLALAESAETKLFRAYRAELELYQIGSSTIYDVLAAHQSLVSARNVKAASRAALDQARITLHRLLRSDQFALIEGCKPAKLEKSEGGFLDWLRGVLNPSSARQTLDEACRPQAVALQRG